jgi:hypothetical protein
VRVGITRSSDEEKHMLDVIFLSATALFVVVAILYVHGCARLR